MSSNAARWAFAKASTRSRARSRRSLSSEGKRGEGGLHTLAPDHQGIAGPQLAQPLRPFANAGLAARRNVRENARGRFLRLGIPGPGARLGELLELESAGGGCASVLARPRCVLRRLDVGRFWRAAPAAHAKGPAVQLGLDGGQARALGDGLREREVDDVGRLRGGLVETFGLVQLVGLLAELGPEEAGIVEELAGIGAGRGVGRARSKRPLEALYPGAVVEAASPREMAESASALPHCEADRVPVAVGLDADQLLQVA